MKHKIQKANPTIWQDSRAQNTKKLESIFDNQTHNASMPPWQAVRLARLHHISIPHATVICNLMGGASHG